MPQLVARLLKDCWAVKDAASFLLSLRMVALQTSPNLDEVSFIDLSLFQAFLLVSGRVVRSGRLDRKTQS